MAKSDEKILEDSIPKNEMTKAEADEQAYLESRDEPTPYVDTWALINKPQGLCVTAVSLLDMMTKLHMTGQFKDEVERCRILAMRNLELATKAFDEYEATIA